MATNQQNLATSRLLRALFRTDPTEGFVQYVQTVKPYHTKILEVLVEYVWTDAVNVAVCEAWSWQMTFSRPQPPVAYDCGYGFVWDAPPGFPSTSFTIKGVTVGLGGKWVVTGNEVAQIPIGATFLVGRNVGGGNGWYTVASVMLNGSGDTDVFVNETIPATSSPHGIMYVLDTSSNLILDSDPADYRVVGVNPGAGTWTISGERASQFPLGSIFNVDRNTVVEFPILGAVDGFGGSWTIMGDQTSLFTPGLQFIASPGGGGGDVYGTFKVLSSVFVLGTTIVSVELDQEVPLLATSGVLYFDYFYTVASVVQGGGTTTITVMEPIPSTSLVEGVISSGTNSFLIQGDVTEKYVEGSYVRVNNSYVNRNNGNYIVTADSVLEGLNTRVSVKEQVRALKPPAQPNDGYMSFAQLGWDDPPYCRLSQASDLHTDTFIAEYLRFEFTDMVSDTVSAAALEDEPRGMGVAPYGSSFGTFEEGYPPTAPTTGIIVMPTGFDGQYFDLGGMDENVSTVAQFYGRTV